MRFALSRATQSTAIDDLTVLLAVVRDGRVGTATTNVTSDDALAASRGGGRGGRGGPGTTNVRGDAALAAGGRAAAAAGEGAARTAGPGDFPGFPAGGPSREHGGFDAATASLDPASGGAALD